MRAHAADELGSQIADLVQAGRPDEACAALRPTLASRTPFRMLDRIGTAAGIAPFPLLCPALEGIAADRSQGGWVVIGAALAQHLGQDLAETLSRCRDFIVAADRWYAADTLGERVPGSALAAHATRTLPLLAPWCQDRSRWVRRAVGVAVHLRAKRSRGQAALQPTARALATFLEPMLEESNVDAAKGVGRGLKTLGKFYPDVIAPWLEGQLAQGRRPRAVVLRKVVTHLPDRQRPVLVD
jgi:hypothetical protein